MQRLTTLISVGALCALGGVLVGQKGGGAGAASSTQLSRAIIETAHNTDLIERHLDLPPSTDHVGTTSAARLLQQICKEIAAPATHLSGCG